MALKKFSNAVQDFTHAVELDKTNAGYVDNRQSAFFALGQLDRALEDANHAMRLAPSYAFVYHSRAMIYDAMKLYDDAIHDLTTAIYLDQNWIELLVDRGKVFAKENDAAISDFNRAIERNGNLTWAIRERGLTYKRMGDNQRARSDLELVLRTEPDDNEIIEALRELRAESPAPSQRPPPREQPPSNDANFGTGFYVSDDGYLITNAHVVNSCSTITVVDVVGESAPGRIVRVSKQDDLALLKTKVEARAVAVFRDSGRFGQGATVFTYGYPLAGLLASSGNVSTGVVTAFWDLAIILARCKFLHLCSLEAAAVP